MTIYSKKTIYLRHCTVVVLTLYDYHRRTRLYQSHIEFLFCVIVADVPNNHNKRFDKFSRTVWMSGIFKGLEGFRSLNKPLCLTTLVRRVLSTDT